MYKKLKYLTGGTNGEQILLPSVVPNAADVDMPDAVQCDTLKTIAILIGNFASTINENYKMDDAKRITFEYNIDDTTDNLEFYDKTNQIKIVMNVNDIEHDPEFKNFNAYLGDFLDYDSGSGVDDTLTVLKTKINTFVYFDRFRIGKGSFGEVYKGYDFQTRDCIAIKVSDINNAIIEIQYLNKIAPNCTQFICTRANLIIDHTAYITTEFIQEKLQERVSKLSIFNPLDLQNLLLLWTNIRNYLHNAPEHIIHLDIKPDNVMFDVKKSLYKLVDFGTCCSIVHDETNKSCKNALGNKGTPMYTNPLFYFDATIQHNPAFHKIIGENLDAWGFATVLFYYYFGYDIEIQLCGDTSMIKYAEHIRSLKNSNNTDEIAYEVITNMLYTHAHKTPKYDLNYITIRCIFFNILYSLIVDIVDKAEVTHIFDVFNNYEHVSEQHKSLYGKALEYTIEKLRAVAPDHKKCKTIMLRSKLQAELENLK